MSGGQDWAAELIDKTDRRKLSEVLRKRRLLNY